MKEDETILGNFEQQLALGGDDNPHKIPQELVEHIIDDLQTDVQALRACSLTCRAWVQRSQYHLHRSVTLYHQNCRLDPKQAESISRLLGLPRVTETARVLVLEGRNVRHGEDDTDHVNLFWAAVSRFTHITALRLTRLIWVTHSLENKDRLCLAFPLVKDLDVYMSDFADQEEFLSFLSGFPRLTKLKLERVLWCESAEEWQNQSGSDPSSYRALPADATPGQYLSSLHVQHCNTRIMDDIARWISTLPSRCIDTLHLSPPDGDDFVALPSYLRTIGASLTHLTLHLEYATQQESMRQAVRGLATATQLRSITLSASFNPLGRKFINVASIFWPCVLVVLESVIPKELHTIRFECQVEDLVHPSVSHVDTLLSQPHFSAVTKLVLALASSPDVPAVPDETVHASLPSMASRGLIRRITI